MDFEFLRGAREVNSIHVQLYRVLRFDLKRPNSQYMEMKRLANIWWNRKRQCTIGFVTWIFHHALREQLRIDTARKRWGMVVSKWMIQPHRHFSPTTSCISGFSANSSGTICASYNWHSHEVLLPHGWVSTVWPCKILQLIQCLLPAFVAPRLGLGLVSTLGYSPACSRYFAELRRQTPSRSWEQKPRRSTTPIKGFVYFTDGHQRKVKVPNIAHTPNIAHQDILSV